MKARIKQLIERIRPEIYNKWFAYLVLSILSFTISWNIESTTFRIITVLAVSLTYSLYMFHISKSLITGFYAILFWIVSITYVASSVKEANLVFMGVLSTITLILLGSLATSFLDLYNSEKLINIIVNYLIFSFFLISTFGILYTSSPVAFEGNVLKNSFDNATIASSKDYMYFSFTTYYSSGYGNYYPVGNQIILINMAQVVLSYVIHIIILGKVVSRMSNKQ